MNNIIKSIISIIIATILMTTNIFSNEINIIAGENRFKTAIEISKLWETSKIAILVNSKATSDLLCATILSSQIDCPILLTDKNNIDESTKNEIKRLKVNKIYLIGGKDVIHETIEEELKKNNINTERISGQDRYETSIKVANKVNQLKKSNTVILVNGEYSVADAVSISPMAGEKNIPVILCKNKEVNNQIEWMKNNNIKNSYIIGGENVIHETIEEKLKKNNINTERVYGKNRYETNAKVIERFYKKSKIEKLFYCKGENINNKDEIIDGMLISSLAAKEKAPIILLGESLSESQKDIIKNKKIKTLIQVGYGVSDKGKNELHKLKESYDDSSTSKPNLPEYDNQSKPEELPSPEIERPNKPNIKPPIVDSEEDEKQESDNTTNTDKPPTNGSQENEDKENESDNNHDETLEEDSKENLGGNGNSENNSQGQEKEDEEIIQDLKYKDYTICKDYKTISINFNKNIDIENQNLDNLKNNISVLIHSDNIYKDDNIDNDSSEKYIKLNKYDKVKIEKNSIIIELDNQIIKNSTIVIKENTVKDSNNNYLKELKVQITEGVEKKISFVKDEHQLKAYLNKYGNDTSTSYVDIIKLESDIKILTDLNITPLGNLTIDGSNGEENFKISTARQDLYKEILIAKDNVSLKNLELENLSIKIANVDNINLKNLRILLVDENYQVIYKSGIEIEKSIVECEDIVVHSDKSAIEIISIGKYETLSKRSTLTINSNICIENINKENSYKPLIILENRIQDIDNNKLNKIIFKNELLEDLYITTKEEIVDFKIIKYITKTPEIHT